jgi:hypothetical protein
MARLLVLLSDRDFDALKPVAQVEWVSSIAPVAIIDADDPNAVRALPNVVSAEEPRVGSWCQTSAAGLDDLSDDTLIRAYHDGGDVRPYTLEGLRAVRNHILRVLAEQAGDAEALGRAAAEGWHEAMLADGTDEEVAGYPRHRAWEDLDPEVQRHIQVMAQAVAARVRAQAQREIDALAAEVVELREHLRWALDDLVHCYAQLNPQEYHDPEIGGPNQRWREANLALSRPLPDAARRLEALDEGTV